MSSRQQSMMSSQMVGSIPSLPVSADGPSLSISAEESATTSNSIPDHVACVDSTEQSIGTCMKDPSTSHSAGTTQHDGGSNWISQIQQQMLQVSISKSRVDSLANGRTSSSVPYLHTSHRIESRRTNSISRILREADCRLLSKSLDLPIYKNDDRGPAKMNKAKKVCDNLEQVKPIVKKVVNEPMTTAQTVTKNKTHQEERGTQCGLLVSSSDKAGSQINGQHSHEEKTETSIQCKQHCEQKKPNAQVSHVDNGKAKLPSTTPRACSIDESLYKVITVSTRKVDVPIVRGVTSEDDTRGSYRGLKPTSDSTSKPLQKDVSTSEQMRVKSCHEMGMQQLSPKIKNSRTSMATDFISSKTGVGQFTTTSPVHSKERIYRPNPPRSAQEHCGMPVSSNAARTNAAESRSTPKIALGDRSTNLNGVYIDTQEATYNNTLVLDAIRSASPTKGNHNLQQETSTNIGAPTKGHLFTSKETTTQTSICRPLDVNSDKNDYHNKIKSLENDLSGIRHMLEDTKSKQSIPSAGEHPVDIPSSIAVPAQRENYANAPPAPKSSSTILSKKDNANSRRRRSKTFEPDSFSPNSSWCGGDSISVVPMRRRSSCQLLHPRRTQGHARKK